MLLQGIVHGYDLRVAPAEVLLDFRQQPVDLGADVTLPVVRLLELSPVRVSVAPLQVTITYPRGGTRIYQRAIPAGLRDRYPSATVKKVLKTIEPPKLLLREAEGLLPVADLNR